MSVLLQQGFQLMGYGLIGVFSVLALFILMINVVVNLCAEKSKPEDDDVR